MLTNKNVPLNKHSKECIKSEPNEDNIKSEHTYVSKLYLNNNRQKAWVSWKLSKKHEDESGRASNP